MTRTAARCGPACATTLAGTRSFTARRCSGCVSTISRGCSASAFDRLLARWTETLQSLGCGCQILPNGKYFNAGTVTTFTMKLGINGLGHEVGTCRFGENPKTSVFDLNCKAHDLDNLYVVDGSFYRLNVFPICVPPLRERAGDVPLLVTFFLQGFAKKLNKPVKQVPDATIRRLASYAWPGNFRELQNVIERAIVLPNGTELKVDAGALPAAPPRPAAAFGVPASAGPMPEVPAASVPASSEPTKAATPNSSLEDVERRHIEYALAQTNWMIEGERGAAKILNLNPSTLRSRLQKLGIKRPDRTS